jgi:hypothetical protein
MQSITNHWQQFTGWLAALDFSKLQPRDLAQSLVSWLWDLSLWLNTGYRGLTIALILLVIVVNRILKRQH